LRMDDFATAILDRPCARRPREPRVGTKGWAPLGGPNKRIRKKRRKKEEFEARFVLDIEIPIQGGQITAQKIDNSTL